MRLILIHTAQLGLLIILSLFLLLHFAILLKIIPYKLVWGGRLKSYKDMYRFEIFSILMNAVFLFVVLIQAGTLTVDLPKRVISYALWLMAGLFLLNTVGNVISKNKLEQRLFTPVTMALTIFSVILALSNN
jgi:hypothetical protein